MAAPVIGRELGDRREVDYAEVERRLREYIVEHGGEVADQLAAIPAARRNHALDAVDVGAFAAIRAGRRRGSSDAPHMRSHKAATQ